MEVEDGNIIDEPLKNDIFIKNSLELNGNFVSVKSPVLNMNGTGNTQTSSNSCELETNSMEVDDIVDQIDLSCIEVMEATMEDSVANQNEEDHMELDDDMMEAENLGEETQTKLDSTIRTVSDDIFLCSEDSLDKVELIENVTTLNATNKTATNGVVHLELNEVESTKELTSLQVEEIAPENYEKFKQCDEENSQSIVELADGDQIAADDVVEEKSYSDGFKIMDISNKCEVSNVEEINVAENLDKLEAALNEISAETAIVVEADDEDVEKTIENEVCDFLDKTSDVFQMEPNQGKNIEEKDETLQKDIEERLSPEPQVINDMEKCIEKDSQLEETNIAAVDKKVDEINGAEENEKSPLENKEDKKNHDNDVDMDDDVSIVENPKEIIFEILDDDSNDKIENPVVPAKINTDIESVTTNNKECSQDQENQLEKEEESDNKNKDKLTSTIIEIEDDDSIFKNQDEKDENSISIPETLANVIDRPVLQENTISMEICGNQEAADIYKNKECINHECAHKSIEYYLAPLFVLNSFNVNKRKKPQFVCGECWEIAVQRYEEYAALLGTGGCLYDVQKTTKVSDCVEVIDSSDEEDNDDGNELAVDALPMKVLSFIENDLETCLLNVFEKVNLQQQMTLCLTSFRKRTKALGAENRAIHSELKIMQKNADKVQQALNQLPKQKTHSLPPLNVNDFIPTTLSNLPPVGEVERPPIVPDQMYYAVKSKPIASWVPCKMVERMDTNKQFYRVKFSRANYQICKVVTPNNLAYYNPPEVRLPIGSRVIAYFDATLLQRSIKEKAYLAQSAFYPGIIAEPLRVNNKFRYLIFYDDGYTQYVKHEDVRLVCSASDNVWEDVHPASREFIQKYLMQYAINRPMVQTQKGQNMQTESDGKWMYARVVDIDCSLVQMQFEGAKTHTEWIYRGSARLGPVFREFQKTNKPPNVVSRLPRRTEPFIRYTADEETTIQQQQEQQKAQEQQQTRSTPQQRPATAKKSVSRPDNSLQLQSQQQQLQYQQQQKKAQLANPQQPVRHLNNSTIYVEDETMPPGKVVYYMARRNLPPSKYMPHHCNPNCLFKVLHNLNTYSPLSKPLLSGWERLLMKQQKNKRTVLYRGPCGKVMRNFKEVHNYLRLTDCCWNVDNFDFSAEISCLAEYIVEYSVVQKRDISGGQEKMPISLVNSYDTTEPPACEYSAQRIPTEGVNLNLDEEFLVGCDCEDDCVDKSKCSCWGLTLAGAKYGNANMPADKVGYQYKRLFDHVPTGIYECNSRCKCKSSCMNRVVQFSLQMKLQVFKTSNRGWGLRCLNDIPCGSFICIYAGHLLTEAKANEGGIDAGDEYFAELDYIEVAEQIKEGYESEVASMDQEESEEESYLPDPEDDVEFTPGKQYPNRKKRSKNTDEDNMERAVRNFNPNADMNDNSGRESSMRKLFGKDEACYIMDAKITGNLGRYFNHSCAPNLFVQNVFVDTHDLRFPWVAFFASSNIRAGTELTWNYNYEVGVVPGKVLYCQCGAPNCRVRLL